MKTAVITVVAGREDHFRRQRQALTSDPPDEHVVVSMDDSAPAIDVGDPPARLLQLRATADGLPLARARNLGASAAVEGGAEALIFLDVDCIPSTTLVRDYQRALAGAPPRALICGPVHYLPPPGPTGYPSEALSRLAEAHPGRPVPPPGRLLAERNLELFWSLSFAASGTTWRALGGFDEGFVGYGAEDTDFVFRARARQATLWWLGGAHAYHQHHPPSRREPGNIRSMVRNAHRFRKRHGWWPMADWLRELADEGLVSFEPDEDRLVILDPNAGG